MYTLKQLNMGMAEVYNSTHSILHVVTCTYIPTKSKINIGFSVCVSLASCALDSL